MSDFDEPRKLMPTKINDFTVNHSKTVVKLMKKTHPDIEKLNTKQIQRIVKRFEESGSVEDRRHSNTGRPRSARSAMWSTCCDLDTS